MSAAGEWHMHDDGAARADRESCDVCQGETHADMVRRVKELEAKVATLEARFPTLGGSVTLTGSNSRYQSVSTFVYCGNCGSSETYTTGKALAEMPWLTEWRCNVCRRTWGQR